MIILRKSFPTVVLRVKLEKMPRVATGVCNLAISGPYPHVVTSADYVDNSKRAFAQHGQVRNKTCLSLQRGRPPLDLDMFCFEPVHAVRMLFSCLPSPPTLPNVEKIPRVIPR